MTANLQSWKNLDADGTISIGLAASPLRQRFTPLSTSMLSEEGGPSKVQCSVSALERLEDQRKRLLALQTEAAEASAIALKDLEAAIQAEKIRMQTATGATADPSNNNSSNDSSNSNSSSSNDSNSNSNSNSNNNSSSNDSSKGEKKNNSSNNSNSSNNNDNSNNNSNNNSSKQQQKQNQQQEKQRNKEKQTPPSGQRHQLK
eukprot:TRINITY_DN8578_c0_g1_i13.p1 TRINITY_DN8578_c0_g1~~TRINITY_DN8578_c0_g1_i13.p1  ORF type:complete len:202 (+),score=69.72 TRINITY_DN8578_c0_g1_i13:113-718(+)